MTTREKGEESVGMTKRIRKLKRELIRKKRAVAEAATLLVLRETIDNVIEKNAGGIDEEVKEGELS